LRNNPKSAAPNPSRNKTNQINRINAQRSTLNIQRSIQETATLLDSALGVESWTFGVERLPSGCRDFILAPMSNIYLALTEQFNRGRLRAIISSGQAVVLHRLAIMSKDGDWILREDNEAIEHVLGTLAEFGAHYRFGAPLDTRWLTGGWSAHLEFRHENLRVRTDFMTRPPRIDSTMLDRLWRDTDPQRPVVDVTTLAQIKKTNREKDYAVIGELARIMRDPRDQLLYSRSARDLIELAQSQPQLVRKVATARPLLNEIANGRDRLEAALDAERRALIHQNEQRLARYREAAQRWAANWPEIERTIGESSLPRAHEIVVRRALELLPFAP
jgi:hypothetical protein